MNLDEKLNEGGIYINGLKGSFAKDGKGFLDEGGAAITAANIGTPVELLTFISPDAVEVLTSPRNATKLFPEVIQGDWSTEAIKYRVEELVGNAAPYGDYSENGTSDVNNEFIKMDTFRIQTLIKCGDLESARTAQAKINLVSSKQKAAANTLNAYANRIYMFGVKGLAIYGIVNHPQLPAAISSQNVGGNTDWADKEAGDIYDDIVKVMVSLESQSDGHVDANSRGKFAMSPRLSGFLNKKNQWGISVKQMIKDSYPNMELVSVPEFQTGAGDYFYAFADEVLGTATGECASQVKMKTFPVIQEVSSIKQKAANMESGFRLNLPFAIARMLVA
jgi:hypothetical protein